MDLGAENVSRGERVADLTLFTELAADGRPSLNHGDVSPGNILPGGPGLFLIAPRGASGEIEYYVAVASFKRRPERA